MKICYLNGEFLPVAEAKISVMDRGFLFGDGIYEVISVYHNKLFRADEHFQRLQNSLSAIKLTLDIDLEEWKQQLHTLLEKNQTTECSIYIQVTRGAQENRNHFIPKTKVKPTVFACVNPLPDTSIEQLRKGVTAVTIRDTRRRDCYIKAITLLANILCAEEALEQGADEAILLKNGYAIEGTSSNLFVVKDNVLYTTPTVPEILGGVTRNLVIELAKQHQIPVEECNYPTDDLAQADEIWLSSSTKEIRPVIRLNDRPVGEGVPGAMWEKMINWYQSYRDAY